MTGKKMALLFSFLCGFLNSIAQEDSLEMAALLFANRQTSQIEDSRAYIRIWNALQHNPAAFKYSGYLDMLSWWASCVGLYQQATLLEDRAFPRKTVPETVVLDDYRVLDAVATIARLAAHEQVVMINEEHRMPRHRTLTLQLLGPLYRLGFRYLAVETLSSDTGWIKAGCPLLQSGTYSRDPIFGELLRTAIAMGYTLVPYDVTTRPEGYQQMNSIQRQMYREETQARNILSRTIEHNPSAKIIVHGGRDHLAEVYEWQQVGSDSFAVGMMAGAFKHFSGINPLTIDQLRHAEHSDSAYSSVVFNLLRGKQLASPLVVLQNKKSGSFLRDRGRLYDLTVVPAPTRFIQGRPQWLLELPGRKTLKVKLNRYQPVDDSTYYLLQAIYAGEDASLAVPADQVAYRKGTAALLLAIKPGLYTIRILDGAGLVLRRWQQKIR